MKSHYITLLTFIALIGLLGNPADGRSETLTATRSYGIGKQLRVTDYTHWQTFDLGNIVAYHEIGNNVSQGSVITYIGFPALADGSQVITSAQYHYKSLFSVTTLFSMVNLSSWPLFTPSQWPVQESKGSGDLMAVRFGERLLQSYAAELATNNTDTLCFVPGNRYASYSIDLLRSSSITTSIGNGKPLLLAFLDISEKSIKPNLLIGGKRSDADSSYITVTYRSIDVSYDIETKMEGVKCYCDRIFNRQIDANTTAYIAHEVKTDAESGTTKIHLTPLTSGYIPAGTPVILKTSQVENSSYHLELNAVEDISLSESEIELIGNNLLRISDGLHPLTNELRLGYKPSRGIGFFQYTDSDSCQPSPNVIYLSLPENQTADCVHLYFEDEASGIEECTENSNSPEVCYDLRGVMDSRNSKGILISNGKLVFLP